MSHFQIECRDENGIIVALAVEHRGGLIVHGDMRAWREAVADMLPMLREQSANFPI